MKKSIKKVHSFSYQMLVLLTTLFVFLFTTNCQKDSLQEHAEMQSTLVTNDPLKDLLGPEFPNLDEHRKRAEEMKESLTLQKKDIAQVIEIQKKTYAEAVKKMKLSNAERGQTLTKSASVIRVPEDYSTMDEALAAAAEGTTIKVTGHFANTDEPLFFLQPGITIDGSGNATWDIGLLFIEQPNITIKGLKMNVTGIIIASNTSNLQVLNCEINNGGGGLILESISNSLIKGNNFLDNSNGPIYMLQCSEITIEDCTVKMNPDEWGGSGIFVDYSSNNIISNCQVKGNDNTNAGIILYNESNHNIIQNCTSTNHSYGIEVVWNSRDNTISNCVAKYNANTGINLVDCPSNKVLNCTANNNGITGITLLYAYDSEIMNCNAQNNANRGAALLSADNNTVKSSAFNNNLLGGLISQGGSSNLIEDCTMNHNKGTGMLIRKWGVGGNDHMIRHNITNSNELYGILFLNAVNNDIIGNTAKNNTGKCDISAYSSASYPYPESPDVNNFSDNIYGTFFCDVVL